MLGNEPLREAIETDAAPPPSTTRVGHKSQAIRSGNFVFVSGQVGVGPDGVMPESVSDQTRQIWKTIDEILKSAGSDIQHVVQTTTYMLDMADVWEIDDVKRDLFPSTPPANAAAGVNQLAYGAKVEIAAIAVVIP
ncbi:RidA family protein [Parafrigoribacterium humi]|uniref:RidA family protein n=1 Tax=Parafrigoribacterium humi TaxID=3144664 RepID=UPI0032EFAEAB